MRKRLRLGSRASILAQRQADLVKDLLNSHGHHHFQGSLEIEIVLFKTSGDLIQNGNLQEYGGKGLFTKEIEEALSQGEIDLAVHSMKDVASVVPEGLIFPCFLPREDPHDVFISKTGVRFDDLPQGAILGTSSLRRKLQALHRRPDLNVVSFRGNVDTRLRKVREGLVDGTFLALAGLRRLGLQETVVETLSSKIMLPAMAQGVIGIQCQENNTELYNFLRGLTHHPTEICVRAERAFAKTVSGTCNTPIAGFAEIKGEKLILEALIISLDGQKIERRILEGSFEDAEKMGIEIGEQLKPILEGWMTCVSS